MTNTEKILKSLKGRKRGVTAAEIAAKTGLKESSTRTALYELTAASEVQRIGAQKTEGRGRPAYLYVAA